MKGRIAFSWTIVRLLGFLGFTTQAFGIRTITFDLPHMNMQVFYLSISNPSNVDQTVDLTVTGNGNWGTSVAPIYVGNGPGPTGYEAMTCSSVSQCNNKSTYRALGKHTSLGFGWYTTIPSPGLGGTGGIILTINVQDSNGGDKGYVVASGHFEYASGRAADVHGPIVINGGRPF